MSQVFKSNSKFRNQLFFNFERVKSRWRESSTKKKEKKLRNKIDFSTKGDSTRSDSAIIIEEQEVIMQFIMKRKRQ